MTEEFTITVRLTSHEVSDLYVLLEHSVLKYEEEAKLAEEALKKASNEEEKEDALKWKEACLDFIATEKSMLGKVKTILDGGA